MSTYVRPDATLPAIAENGGRASMSPNEIGQGWSVTSQTRPPADKFNARDFLTSAGLKYLCRLGIAEYSADEQYQGRGLAIGSNGSIYWNLVPCQGVDPVTDSGGYWEKTMVRVHDLQDYMSGQMGGFLTQAQANALYVDWGTFYSTRDTHWATISDISNNLTWVANRTSALESWRGDAQNWMNWRDGTFDELLWWRDQHSNDISQLYGRANTADAGISAVNGRVNQTDANVGAVNSRVDGLMPQSGSGWLQLPNGVIQQWQQYSQDGGAAELTRNLAFPRVFPTACWNVSLTTGFQGTGQGNSMMMYQVFQGWNNSGVNVYRARSGSNNNTITWPIVFAIGN